MKDNSEDQDGNIRFSDNILATVQVEDHYYRIVEPGSLYNYLKEENLLDQPIYVIGADGTDINVGADNGAIHYLERMLGKPLHYFICQLHGNDLSYRAVF